MGTGRQAGPPFLLSPVSLRSGVTYELGKEALDVCLRRNRRAPQAFPGRGDQRGWRGARQPQRPERYPAGAGRDRRLSAGTAGRVTGGVRLWAGGGVAGGFYDVLGT